MNLKKFALRGLIVLAVFVALCMFFSGTIKTISTAKVRLVSARNGKLEEKIALSGKVTYPSVEKLTVPVPEGQSVTIVRVNTRPGYTVSEGDVLVEAEITGYAAAVEECENNYTTAMEQLMALESKSTVRVRRSDEEYADAYFALRDAKQETMFARVSMDALLSKAGLVLPEEGYPQGADEDLVSAVDAYRDALSAEADAQAAFDRAARYGVDEAAWTYITQRRQYQEQMDASREKMQLLMELQEAVAEITAPWDGYTAEVNVSQGDTCTGAQWLISVTAEQSDPVLRVDLSNVERTIVRGLAVNVNSDRYGFLETKVIDVGATAEGAKYCDVEITGDMLSYVGSVYSMSQSDVEMSIVYKAKETTNLLPSSAVHGTGSDRYVYIVDRDYNTFGGSNMKVRKYNVTVLNEVDGTVSIQEEISYYTLAYMEDRQIGDGDTVMEYTD